MLGVCRHRGARSSRVQDLQVSVYYYPTTATVATPRSLSSITCTARTTLGVTQQQQHTIVRAPVPTRLIHQSCLSPTSPRGRTCTDGARAQTAQSPTGRSRASHSQGHSGQRHCPHSPQLATRGAQTKRAVMSNKYRAGEARQIVARSKSKEAPRGRAISDRPKAKGRESAREKEGRRALAVVPQLGSSLQGHGNVATPQPHSSLTAHISPGLLFLSSARFTLLWRCQGHFYSFWGAEHPHTRKVRPFFPLSHPLFGSAWCAHIGTTGV